MRPLPRSAHLLLPVGLITCLMVILVPLPPGITDLLLAANLACSALILLTAISIQAPLEFSVFPALLLATTFMRLVLNIATTRLILSSAHASGLDSAGGIIRSFGQFVAGDQLAVGIIIFLILVMVQFVVITKGASRISEVAARFALDGMPGRQMAIDADLNAGAIDLSTARQQREELSLQADFYGAMDGASKYVRGDALVGMLIIGVNILGGLYMGLVESGMSLRDATETYIKLAIGDGLVSQLPAFLISLAAGILVSRGSRASNLSGEFIGQLIRRPEPLFVVAAFLSLMIFAKLPAIPLLLVGGACVALAVATRTANQVAPETKPPADPATAAAPTSRAQTTTVEQCLAVEPLELELGVALLRLADPQRGGDLLERIAQLRNRTAVELGLILPKLRIRDNMSLHENAYRIRLFGSEIGHGKCYPLRAAVTGLDAAQRSIDGIAAVDPLAGGQVLWIDPAEDHQLAGLPVRIHSAAEWMIHHLQHVIRVHAEEFLTRDAVQRLLDHARESAPTIVTEIVPDQMSLAELQQALKALVASGLSIRNLPHILEALSDATRNLTQFEEQVNYVRQRMMRSFCSQFSASDGSLLAITLAPEIENWFRGQLKQPQQSNSSELGRLVDGILSRLRQQRSSATQPVIVVGQAVRAALQHRLRRAACAVPVLAREEIESHASLRDAGCITWSAM